MSDMIGHETHGHSSNTEINWCSGSDEISTENSIMKILLAILAASALIAIVIAVSIWLLYKPVS